MGSPIRQQIGSESADHGGMNEAKAGVLTDDNANAPAAPTFRLTEEQAQHHHVIDVRDREHADGLGDPERVPSGGPSRSARDTGRSQPSDRSVPDPSALKPQTTNNC